MIEEEMIDRYLSAVRFYTCFLGIWPFDKSWKKHVFSTGVQLSCIVASTLMIGKIVTSYSFTMLTQQIPFTCAVFIMGIKHTNYFLKQSKFGEILTNMIHDWHEEKTKEEKMIMTTYAKRGVFYSLLYQVNIFFTMFVLLIVPLVPRTLDLILPLNESRPRLYPYEGYYYVNPNDYYYGIIAFNWFTLLVGGFILVGCDICMIHLMQHACGLLMIAGHRFKYAVEATRYVPMEGSNALKDPSFKKLRIAFNSHNKAIQHLMKLESAYAINLVFQLFIMITSFSITLFEVAMNEISVDMCKLYTYFISQSVHMLFLNLQGQFILNSHDTVYNMIYEAMWYIGSPKVQLWYVIALRASLDPPILTIGGLMPLHLNSFSELLKICVSYYTVLRSS